MSRGDTSLAGSPSSCGKRRQYRGSGNSTRRAAAAATAAAALESTAVVAVAWCQQGSFRAASCPLLSNKRCIGVAASCQATRARH
jgi:hypothetical protein